MLQPSVLGSKSILPVAGSDTHLRQRLLVFRSGKEAIKQTTGVLNRDPDLPGYSDRQIALSPHELPEVVLAQGQEALDRKVTSSESAYVTKCINQLSSFVAAAQTRQNTLHDLGELLYTTSRNLGEDGVTPNWDAEQHLAQALRFPKNVASVLEALGTASTVYLHIHVSFEPCNFCSWVLNSYGEPRDCAKRELFVVTSADAPY